MTPKYVIDHLSPEDPIKHEWSDWDPYELIDEVNVDTISALQGITLSGMLSFIVGCTEWVTYRCAYDPAYRLPFEYIEAFWVYLAGMESVLPDETTDDDRWQGPRDGPINLILGKFYTTNHTYDIGGAPHEAAFAAQVALYVMSDTEPFLRWQDKVLSRLKRYYSARENEDEVIVVPQQLLDPEFDYQQEMVNSYIKQMLNGLDCQSNRFLQHHESQIITFAKEL